MTLFLQEIPFKKNDLHLHLLFCNETHFVRKHVKKKRNTCPIEVMKRDFTPSVRNLTTTSKSTTMNNQ
jgi:hypothetical protein